MKNFFTPVYSTRNNKFQHVPVSEEMSPRESTVNKIMQFAASYRVQKVSDNEFVQYFLN